MPRTVRTNTYAITIPDDVQISQHLDKIDAWLPAQDEGKSRLKFNIDTVVMSLADVDEASVAGERLAGTVSILDLKFDGGVIVSHGERNKFVSLDRQRDDDNQVPTPVQVREYRINGWAEEGSWFADEARFVRAIVLCSAPDHFHTVSAYFPTDDAHYFDLFEEIIQSLSFRGELNWLIEDEHESDAQFEKELAAHSQDLIDEEAHGEDVLIPDLPGELTVSDLRKPLYHDEGYFEFRYSVPCIADDLKCRLYEFTSSAAARSDEDTHTMRQQFVRSLNLIASVASEDVLEELKRVMLEHYQQTCQRVDVVPENSTISIDPANPLNIHSPDDAWALCDLDEAFLSMEETFRWGAHLFACLHLFPTWDSGQGAVVIFRDGAVVGLAQAEANYSEYVVAG